MFNTMADTSVVEEITCNRNCKSKRYFSTNTKCADEDCIVPECKLYSSKVMCVKCNTALSFTVASFLAPLLGWLADVRFGRYEIIKFGSLVSFFVSILFYLAVFIEGLRNVFSAASIGIARFGSACFSASMLPFLTDQLIGATSDELSAVVQWYI